MPSSYKRELAMEMGRHQSGSMKQKEVEMEGGPDPDDTSHFTKRQQNSLEEGRSDLEKDESLFELNGSPMRGKPHQHDKSCFTVNNLLTAAVYGDVEFLRVALHNQSWLPLGYFLFLSRDKSNIIHLAVKGGHGNFIREALEKLPTPTTVSLLCGEEGNDGNTPLHVAAYRGNFQLVKLMVEEVNKRRQWFKGSLMRYRHLPWWARNYDGKTPLQAAMRTRSKATAIALFFLEMDAGLVDELNDDELERLRLEVRHREETGKLLLERFWWLVNATDRYGKTALQVAKEMGVQWAVRLLSSLPSNLRPFDYVAASEGAHCSSILAFLNLHPDFFSNCLAANDTPLHHIKVENVEEFLDFLRNPLIQNMKNVRDCDGATPLHRALECKDILLAELLLTSDGVDKSIKDKNQKTTMDLLADLSNQDPPWEEMCRRIGIAPWERPTDVLLETNHIDVTQETDRTNDALQTSHGHVTLETDVTDVPSGTNLFVEMRKPLIAVASLLIALSFAAAVTVPGGLNTNTGEAIMAKNAAFSVFVLADAIVFCCSSCLSDVGYRMLILIRRAMLILMLAFNGTRLAFPAGIFVILFHKSLLLAIVICVLCAVVGISANRSLLLKFLTAGRLTPAATREDRDRSRLLEEGFEFSRR